MRRMPLLHALLATTALTAPGLAQTLPSGGAVASGSATISTPAAGRMAIQQGSDRAIVNWQSFSVGQGGRVDIQQPSSSSAILNRVTGTAPSSIAGQVSANGQVVLVNPNGIAVTPTGSVAAAGFVGSTLDIADEDFRAGRLRFQGGGASAHVSNEGRITAAPGGYAALIGGTVSNSGTISAPAGRVALGSGEAVTLDLSGDGFLQVAVPTQAQAPGRGALVRHAGTISAPGGRVEIAAATAREAARRAVDLSGVVEATGVSGRNGRIVLSGGEGGAVRVTGRLDASSPEGTGGAVTVTGQSIALRGATIEASGATGGGVVRVGGGREGRGPTPRAERLRVDAATTIRADATRRGNGGDVVLWSERATDFRGRIEARGGAQGGNGGEAEVSSRGVLGYGGTTILTAAAGRFGTLLLDPWNITISDAPGTNATGFTATGADSVINATALTTALATANVTVSTGTGGTQTGDITVVAPLDWNSGTVLTLQAAWNIAINAPITPTKGSLTLDAGGSITAAGAIGVDTFILARGGWRQNTDNLPAFAAQDFRITGGSFLRVAGGSGTDANPYRISDSYGLQGIGSRVAEWSRNYVLTGNIDASGTRHWNGGAGFKPIGNTVNDFAGVLDGAGHVISGLTINRPAEDRVGLIGVLGDMTIGLPGNRIGEVVGSVRNLGLLNHSITGRDYVGALIGEITHNTNQVGTGLITNVHGTGQVSGRATIGGLIGMVSSERTLVSDARSAANVSASATSGLASAGGLVGTNSGTILRGQATGQVNVSLGPSADTGESRAGGLVGFNTGSITESHATGSVALLHLGSGFSNNATGGLVGLNAGTIGRSHATGGVSVVLGATTISDFYAGGLVGQSWLGGAISEVQATGSVSVQNTHFGRMTFAGGLVGQNLGTIARAHASGSVVLTGGLGSRGRDAAGGIVGHNEGSVGQSYATGNVSGGDRRGGIAGENSGTISGVHASGRVGDGDHTGGLVGFNQNSGTVTSSFWDTETTGRTLAAGGDNIALPVDDLTTVQARRSDSYTGWDFQTVWFQAGDMRPILRSEAATPVGGVIPIRTLNQLQLMATNPGAAYRLERDITATETQAGTGSQVFGAQGFAPVGVFTGSLDGGGFRISDLGVRNDGLAYAGLFSEIGAGGAVSNLRLENAKTRGGFNVGTLAGANAGTVTHVSAYGTAEANGGLGSVGGLVGLNSGTITGAAISVFVSGPAANAGGVVGYNSGILRQAYATDTVTNATLAGGVVGRNEGIVDQVYATGSASGTTSGSLIGRNNGTVTAGYWNSSTSTSGVGAGAGSNAGIAGRTSAQMQDITAFRTNWAGFDFDTAWAPPNRAEQGGGMAHYPELYALSNVVAVLGASRAYGDANPASLVTIAGLRAGETASMPGSFATAATAASGAGSYAITGTGTFSFSSPTGRSVRVVRPELALTVTPRPITVTADAVARDYGDANPALTYTVGGRGLVNGDALSGGLATSATARSGVGAHAITQGTLGAGANYAITYLGAELTVTPRPVTVTADARTRDYGDANPALTYAVGGRGLANGDALSGALSTTANATSGVGSHAITQGTLTGAANPNYAITYIGAELTVAPRPITLAALPALRDYGDANPAFLFSVHGRGLVNGDALSGALATAATAASGVGGYAITQGSLSAPANYAVTFLPATLTVVPRAITVTADARLRDYGDANPAFTYAVGGRGLVNGDLLSGSLLAAADERSPVGSYAITPGTLTSAANPNYAITHVGAMLGIVPRPVTVTADALGRAYGDANPTLTYQVGGRGLAAGDHLLGVPATAATAASGVGSYAITQGNLTEALNPNYAIAFTGAELTVTPRNITIYPDAWSREYGDANRPLTWQVGGRGLANGDVLAGALATAANPSSAPGLHAITQGTLTSANNPNYAVSFFPVNIGILPRAITVTADARSRIYGDANPPLTYRVGGRGLVEGDALAGELATLADAASGIGRYAITLGSMGGGANRNYAIAYTGAELTVTPRPLRVTANPQTRLFGNANPPLTYAVGGRGLVNRDRLSGALATPARPESNPGRYAITRGTLSASGNYALSFTPAELTILPRPAGQGAGQGIVAGNRLLRDLAAATGGAGLPDGNLPSPGTSLAGQPMLTRIASLVSDGSRHVQAGGAAGGAAPGGRPGSQNAPGQGAPAAAGTLPSDPGFAGAVLCLGGACLSSP